MFRSTLLSFAFLTFALAAPVAAEEPGEAIEQSPAELVEQLDRYQGEFTDRLQQQLEGRMNIQLSDAPEPAGRSRRTAGATVARSR